MRTYQAKLSCANCGMEAFYRMPYGALLIHYSEIDDDEVMSSYSVKDEQFDNPCMNCGLQMLCGNDFWEQPLPNFTKQEDDGFNTSNSAS